MLWLRKNVIKLSTPILDQYAKGLVYCEAELGEEIQEQIARLQWRRGPDAA